MSKLRFFYWTSSALKDTCFAELFGDRPPRPKLLSREKLYPPPPSPHFWPISIFQGRGVGVYILSPHAAGILYAPPFYTPPTPRRVFSGVGGWGCTWVKPGRFGSFFVLCFLALGGHCLQMLCLPGFGRNANNQNLPHFRAFPASIQEHSPPKCLFFMANAKLPNRPGFALLRGGGV